MFSNQCKLHLKEVGETGPQHMLKALKVAVKLQLLVPALVVHSVAPRFFSKTATKVMTDILENR
tara:strand:+ start:60 stop:251 length:192 start_codon:yes stop_codon:yes gene_type:complete